MADRVANQRKPKAGSRENKPLAFPAAVNWDHMFATPDERAALDSASVALDRAAEALAALVSPKAFKAKLADLGRGRAKRGRPPGRTGELWFIRFLLEATGDVEGARLDTGCTAPGCLDNGLRYAARLKVSSCQTPRMWAGLRWPFFSISHSAL